MEQKEEAKATKSPAPPTSAKPKRFGYSRLGVKVEMVTPDEVERRRTQADETKRRQKEIVECCEGLRDLGADSDGSQDERQREEEDAKEGGDESTESDSEDEEKARLIPEDVKRVTIGDEFFTISGADCKVVVEPEEGVKDGSDENLDEAYANLKNGIVKWDILSAMLIASTKAALESYGPLDNRDLRSNYESEESRKGMAHARMVQSIADDVEAVLDEKLESLQRAGFEQKKDGRVVLGDPEVVILQMKVKETLV